MSILSTHVSEFARPLPDPGPFVERILELYKEASETSQGKVVFLAGELGTGKSELIDGAVNKLKSSPLKPALIAGRFSGKGYEVLTDNISPKISNILNVAGNAAGLVASIFFPQAAALIIAGQAMQASSASIDAVKAHLPIKGEEPKTPFWLLNILPVTARQKPLICLIDNYDKTEDAYGWNGALLSLAELIATDLPIIFVVSMDNNPAVEITQASSELKRFARELVDREMAEWWPLRALELPEIAEWIGLDTYPGMVTQLRTFTGGVPAFIKKLWRNWLYEQEIIFFNIETDRLEWVPGKTPNVDPFKAIFEDLLRFLVPGSDILDFSEIKRLLATAALEGMTFTADALAKCYKDKYDNVDYLCNFLDEHLLKTAERAQGILTRSAPVVLEDGRELTTYTFVSDLHWFILNRFIFTSKEKIEKNKLYALGLNGVYGEEEWRVASTLARLYRAARDFDKAKHYQTIADFNLRQESYKKYAFALLEVDTSDWDPFRTRSTGIFLKDAAMEMMHVYPYPKVLEVCQKALVMLEKSADKINIAHTLVMTARIKSRYGDIIESDNDLTTALKLFTEENYPSGILKCHLNMMELAHFKGDFDAVQALANKTLEILDETEDRYNYTFALTMLSTAMWAKGDLDNAIKNANRSLRFYEEFENQNGIGTLNSYLGRFFYSQGDYERSEELFQKAFEAFGKSGGKTFVAVTLLSLARTHLSLRNIERALYYLEKAFKIFEEMLARTNFESAKLVEAQILNAQGNYEAAESKALEAVLFYREASMSSDLIESLNRLAEINISQNRFSDALIHTGESLEILKTRGEKHLEAEALYFHGKAYYGANELEKAKAIAETALEQCEKIGYRHISADVLRLLGKITYALKDNAKAVTLAERSAQLYEEIKVPDSAEVRKEIEKYKNRPA